jgi:hypothetical protein
MPTCTPHTRIDNSIIDDCASQIGIYGLGIYVAIKRHLNQKTGECYPSYQKIARKLGIDRGTVIRYVKKLKALKLLSPQLRFTEDGSPTSNQYNFDNDGGSEQPQVVAQDNYPGGPKPPEQSSSLNKKQRTSTDGDFSAEKNPQNSHEDLSTSHKNPQTPIVTERQKTCPHPPSEIAFLPAQNMRICHHCWLLLDDNLVPRERFAGV